MVRSLLSAFGAICVALPLAAGLTACDDSLLSDPALVSDTVSVGAPGGGSGLPTAIDLARVQGFETITSRPETPADANRYDFLLRWSGGRLVFRPYEPITGGEGAGVSPTSRAYESIDEAPRADREYVDTEVALALNGVYFLRSRPWSNGYQNCVTYAKAKVTKLDAATQSADVLLTLNANCDDERLKD